LHAKGFGEVTVGGSTVEKPPLETEPETVVPMHVVLSKSALARRRTVVYLRNRDATRDGPEIFENLAQAGRIAVVADVRGFGMTMSRKRVPDTRIGYFHPGDSMEADFTYASFLLGRPLLGMRVWDALQFVAYARSRPDVDPRQVSLVGRGWAGLVAVFAGVLDPRVSAVADESIPVSHADMAMAEADVHPVSLMPPAVLEDFDLGDVMGAIRPRPLLVLDPTDSNNRRMTAREASRAFAYVLETYHGAYVGHALKVLTNPYEPDIEKELESWLVSP
jgi:hypothetical protein